MTLAYDVLRGGFIQIVHDGFGHWLTISTIEATSSTEVFIYDSMYASMSTNVKQQIAAIMARPEEKITVKMMDAQKQAGWKRLWPLCHSFHYRLDRWKTTR